MKIFARFIEEWQEDLKYFLYWCLVFTLFRLAFILYFSSQLNCNYTDIPMALFLGLRLSFKTTGIICLIGFVLATLPRLALGFWPAKKLRFAWHSLALLFFSLCFMARISYYKIFNAAFNMMIINGMHDDKMAILDTAIKEYQLLWRLPCAIILGAAFVIGAHYFCKIFPPMGFKLRWSRVFATTVFIAVLAIFVRYGGAFNYGQSINWESAARLNSNLLNEAILDDGQALYRVYAGKKKLDTVIASATSIEELYKQLNQLGLKKKTNSIDGVFERTVIIPKLAKQPTNIVLLVGESFGEWPFLEKFSGLGLVPKLQVLRNTSQGVSVGTMMANGHSTITSLNGLITGLPDTGVFENYQPNSFRKVYKTGIGYVLKQMGYKTVFWYGGYGEWQNLKNFVLAQSFDEFHGADEVDKTQEFAYATSSSWGVSDELFLKHISNYIREQKVNEKVFHFIMTTSNHPPYSLDVDKIGFPKERVKAKLTNDFHNDAQTIKELGHIWYADKTMGDFIENVQAKNEDALFVITGDHSERTDFAREQDYKTTSAVPCIFYGNGVQRDWFTEKSVGTHIQLAGTLAEIAAPKGFKYSSMMPSMFEKQNFVFNYRFYADAIGIHTLNKLPLEKNANMEALKKIAIYRVLNGNEIE